MIELHLEGERGAQRIEVHLKLEAPWTVLFGASGAGKSSVLRAIAGLWKPATAAVTLNGKSLTNLPAHRRGAVLIAQQSSLFPHLTALENVFFAMHADSRKDEDAMRLLERVHAAHTAAKKPHTLSGGEQQRVALARALAAKPQLLLLDEAFSGTDTALRAELVTLLKHWQAESGAQIVSVTHDIIEAIECAEEVAVLTDGRVTAQGPSAEALHNQRASLLRTLGHSKQ